MTASDEIFDHHKRTLKQKPSSIWIFELINKNSANYGHGFVRIRYCQTHRTRIDSIFFVRSLRLYSPSFDLVLSLIVLIELICPHFIVRVSVAARHITSMHVSDWNVFTQQSMLLSTYFKYIFFFLVFAVNRCLVSVCVCCYFSLVYFAIKWARLVLGIYISHVEMLRGTILLLCSPLWNRKKKTNDGADDAANHYWPHTVNSTQQTFSHTHTHTWRRKHNRFIAIDYLPAMNISIHFCLACVCLFVVAAESLVTTITIVGHLLRASFDNNFFHVPIR